MVNSRRHVVVVAPCKVGGTAVRQSILEAVASRSVKNLTELLVGIVQPSVDSGYGGLPGCDLGSELCVEAIEDNLLRSRGRRTLGDHIRGAVNARNVDEEEVACSDIVDLLH